MQSVTLEVFRLKLPLQRVRRDIGPPGPGFVCEWNGSRMFIEIAFEIYFARPAPDRVEASTDQLPAAKQRHCVSQAMHPLGVEMDIRRLRPLCLPRGGQNSQLAANVVRLLRERNRLDI